MAMPPQVSGMAFPVETGAQERSNYLTLGAMGEAGYVVNVTYGYGAGMLPAINDETYTLTPMIKFDRTNTRVHADVAYSPSWVFYQHTTTLNQSNQNAIGELDYRISPHSGVILHDTFLKTDNAFSVPLSQSGGGVSAAPGNTGSLVIAPYANQISNDGGGTFSYQFSAKSMIGLGGGAAQLDYPNTRQVPGLYNSDTYTGNAFLNQRISSRQYMGVTGNYFYITETPPGGKNSTTQTTAFLPFYTLYPRRNILLSVSAGPLYYDVVYPPLSNVTGWAPSMMASLHADEQHLTFSTSYQRTVTAGGGLLGAFTTDIAALEIREMLSRTWTAGVYGNYTNNKGLESLKTVVVEHGHTETVGSSIVHMLGPHMTMELGYDFLHQTYAGIPLLNNSPSSQKVYGNLQYQLTRPLGR